MDSPGQNTGVGSLSLLRGIFPTQGSNPGLLQCRQIIYQLSHKASPRILEWVAYPSPVDLPDPGIKPGSPASQADSLPTELLGKSNHHSISLPMNLTTLGTSHKWNYMMCPFVKGLLHLTWCLQASSMLQQVSEFSSFLKPHNILLCVYTRFVDSFIFWIL